MRGWDLVYAVAKGRASVSIHPLQRRSKCELDFLGGGGWWYSTGGGKNNHNPDRQFPDENRVQFRELSGVGGYFVGLFRKRDVVEGTESGIVNMTRLSEEMQGSETFILN